MGLIVDPTEAPVTVPVELRPESLVLHLHALQFSVCGDGIEIDARALGTAASVIGMRRDARLHSDAPLPRIQPKANRVRFEAMDDIFADGDSIEISYAWVLGSLAAVFAALAGPAVETASVRSPLIVRFIPENSGDGALVWEHRDFPRADWARAVANDDTVLGYWEWAWSQADQSGEEND